MVYRVGETGRKSDLMTPGQVYFIQAGNTGSIKIGWSSNVEKRLRMLQVASPEPLSLLHKEAGTGRDERNLHHKFCRYHAIGEWFKPHPELLAYIKERMALPPSEWVAGATEPSRRLVPRGSRTDEQRALDKAEENMPDEYWEPGNPGWDGLVKAANSLCFQK